MKKINFPITYIFIYFFFIPFLCAAKKNDSIKSYKVNISINGGIGFPIGDFGTALNLATTYVNSIPKTSFGSIGYFTNGGFAKQGLAFNLISEVFMDKANWGTVGFVGFNSNSINVQELINYSNTNAAPINLHYRGLEPDYSSAESKNNYENYNFQIGVFYETSASFLSLDLRGMVGVASCKSPALTFYSGQVSSGDYSVDNYNSVNAISFCLDLGLSIRANIIKRMFISLNADFIHAEPTFYLTESSNIYTYPNQFFVSRPYPVDCPISIINTTLGLGYRL